VSPTVLLTGPAGVVGTALVERLDAGGLICLTHQSDVEGTAARTVRGDVSRPRLGLTLADYDELAREVDVVVHSAAVTRFDASREETFAVNVEGTRNMLGFVEDSGARLLQLSTAFVTIGEVAQSGWVGAKHYLDSKRAAEALVEDSGLDFYVIRPSVIVGDSHTGEVARLQGFHFFMRALLKDDLPILPVEDGDLVDFVPADLVADVVAAMVDEPPPTRSSWITAGERAWSAAKSIDEARAAAAKRDHPVPRPRLVAPEMVDRLIRPVFFPELPKRIVRRYDQVTSIATVVVTPHPFESSLDELSLHYGRDFELDLDRTFRSSIGYLIDTLGRPVEA
jgi:nucleoside-diphosphate-sugar epimerase